MRDPKWNDRFELDADFHRQYELLAPIGKGAMGEVIRARQLSVGRDVAIKFLSPQFFEDEDCLRRFHNEAAVLARINHPNVVHVITFAGDASVPYIVLEHVDGGSLRSLVRKKGPLPVGLALRMLAHIAKGLAQAHAAGIIHRDLKSENVLVGRKGVAKIVDFGIAKLTEGRGDQTASGVILGTPESMSPEQVRGDPLDERTDLYSAGVILFEMLTGVVPFKHDAVSRILLDHLETPPPLLREVQAGLPAELDELVRRCLAKDRLARFRSTEALLLALQGTHRSLARQKLLEARAGEGAGGMTAELPARPAPGGKDFETRRQRARRSAGGAAQLSAPGSFSAAAAEPVEATVPWKPLAMLVATFLFLGAATLAYRSTLGARRDEGEVRVEAQAESTVALIDGLLETHHAEAGGDPAHAAFTAGAVAKHLGTQRAGDRAAAALRELVDEYSEPEVVTAAGLPLAARGDPLVMPALLRLFPQVGSGERAEILDACLAGARRVQQTGGRFLGDPALRDEACETIAGLLEEPFTGRYGAEERARLIQLHAAFAASEELQRSMLDFTYRMRFDRRVFASPEEFAKLGRLARDPRLGALRKILERHFYHRAFEGYMELTPDRLRALGQGMGRP